MDSHECISIVLNIKQFIGDCPMFFNKTFIGDCPMFLNKTVYRRLSNVFE